jgi:hypothetical protein
VTNFYAVLIVKEREQEREKADDAADAEEEARVARVLSLTHTSVLTILARCR